MDPRALRNIIDTFLMFKQTCSAEPPPAAGEVPFSDKATRSWSQGGMTFFLQDEPLEKYEAFLTKWERAPWVGKWSEKHRVDKIQSAIVEAWNAEDDGVKAFTEVANGFDALPERFTVWLPLSGIDLQMDELRLGDVRIIQLTQQRAND